MSFSTLAVVASMSVCQGDKPSASIPGRPTDPVFFLTPADPGNEGVALPSSLPAYRTAPVPSSPPKLGRDYLVQPYTSAAMIAIGLAHVLLASKVVTEVIFCRCAKSPVAESRAGPRPGAGAAVPVPKATPSRTKHRASGTTAPAAAGPGASTASVGSTNAENGTKKYHKKKKKKDGERGGESSSLDTATKTGDCPSFDKLEC